MQIAIPALYLHAKANEYFLVAGWTPNESEPGLAGWIQWKLGPKADSFGGPSPVEFEQKVSKATIEFLNQHLK